MASLEDLATKDPETQLIIPPPSQRPASTNEEMIGVVFPPHRRWGGTNSGPDRDVGDLLVCPVIGAAKSHGESDSDCF